MYLNGIAQFSKTLKSIMNQMVDLRQCTDYFEEYEKYISMNSSKTKKGELKPIFDTNNLNIEFHHVSLDIMGRKHTR